MTTTLLVILILSVLGTGAVLWMKLSAVQPHPVDTDAEQQLRAQKEQLAQDCALLRANLERKSEELGQTKALAEEERSEKNELQGKGKQLHVAYTKLEAKNESLQLEHDALKKQMAKHDAELARKEQEFDAKIAKLEAAKASLDHERDRVIREEQEARQRTEEERDRLWNDHENTVVAKLTDLCKQPALSFTSYTNTHLPDGFDGSLKPDFMIEFLGQYVIFDAKVSKAKSLRTYVTDQVKKTVEKVKDNDRIYKSIYLVVPTSALSELTQHFHIVDGYSIFIISVEALPALLASLKRITHYEFAEQMDPQQRDNIVQLVAELDFHINLRNAADLLLTKMGTSILEKAQRTDPALAEEVAIKKLPMNANARSVLSQAELKRLVSSLTAQVEEAHQLVSPKAPIRTKELKAAEVLMTETLFE